MQRGPVVFILTVAGLCLALGCSSPGYKFTNPASVGPRCQVDGMFLKGPWENAELIAINGEGALSLGERVRSMARFRSDTETIFADIWTDQQSYSTNLERSAKVDPQALIGELDSGSDLIRLAAICPNYDDPRQMLPRSYVLGFLQEVGRRPEFRLANGLAQYADLHRP